MHPSHAPHRITSALLILGLTTLALVASVLVPSLSRADALWQHDRFWTFGPIGRSDSTVLRFTNNADIDIVSNQDSVSFGHQDSARALATMLDTLTSPVFDLKCILHHAKPQNVYVITSNSDAKCNQTYIVQSLCDNHYRRPSVLGFGLLGRAMRSVEHQLPRDGWRWLRRYGFNVSTHSRSHESC